MNDTRKNILQSINDYGRQLFRFIRGKVASDADAEDILQEVWYQFSNVAEVEDIGSISGWLYRVARNRIADNFRKKRPDALEDYQYRDDSGDLHFSLALPVSDDTPEGAYLRQLFWDELSQALNELPEAQRSVFVRNELEDMTLQEIAEQDGVPLKTTISRKRYAVLHLRERMDNLYQSYFQE